MAMTESFFPQIFALFAVLAVACGKPAFLAAPVAYTAPLTYPAPLVPAATSSQYVARNYNGIVAAPYVASAYTYPTYAAAYPSAYTAYPYASAAYVSL